MHSESDYYDLWSDMDEMLIRHPELSELWLDQAKLSALRARYPKEQLNDYFRKRAFTALVMEKIFRIFEMNEGEGAIESEGDGGESAEYETITLDNPELRRIWEDDVRDEYSNYPEFIEYVAQNIFDRASR
ncbi:MAG: hypothetical protein ACM3JD_07595 [Rudaea sp.]